MSQRQQNKLRATQKIVAAAEALIATQGVHATTTRAIAKHAGVSYQTLYNYFPSKALLVRELLKSDYAVAARQIDLVLKSYDGELIDSLLRLCDLVASALLGPRAELWQTIAQQPFSGESERGQSSTLSLFAHEHCYSLLHTAHGMGHLKPGTDLHLMAHTLFSLCNYNLLMLHNRLATQEQYLHTQREQFDLVLGPYRH